MKKENIIALILWILFTVQSCLFFFFLTVWSLIEIIFFKNITIGSLMAIPVGIFVFLPLYIAGIIGLCITIKKIKRK